MIQIKEKQNCCGCQACVQACPKGCIKMETDGEGFLYPIIDNEVCIDCGLCERICPVLHSAGDSWVPPKAYASYNLNEKVRLASSSGGVFTLAAEYVLNQGGVIYGAAMEELRVKHVRVVDRDGLDLLRGSKYVQSNIGRTYAQARDDLKAGKLVLFTGTPCQIEGLNSFLRKKYENLIAMDIICHGVPSPMVWEKYLLWQERATDTSVKRAMFRNKKYGWKTFSMFLEFADTKSYVCRYNEDLFMKAFLYDLCLRPSCYQCHFKKINRVSDMTVADFWGIRNICPEMDDDRGTSLVLVHSSKGSEIMTAISSGMVCREVPFEDAIRGNPAMISSAAKPKTRNLFMNRVNNGDFEKLVLRYAKEPFSVKRLCKRILKRTGILAMIRR